MIQVGPLVPAGGRDYKTLREVQESFDADYDFFLARESCWTKMSELRSQYPGIEKFPVLYDQRSKSGLLKMPPPPDFGEAINEAESEEWLKKGSAFKEARKWDIAIHCFSEAIRLNPVPYDAWYERGSVYKELKSHLKAIEDFTEACDRDFHLLLDTRAREYLKIGEYGKAAEDFFQCGVEEDCNRTHGFLSDAFWGLLNTGEYDQAIEVAYNLIQATTMSTDDPSYYASFLPDAYTRRGEFHLLNGDFGEAIADLIKVIRSRAPFGPAGVALEPWGRSELLYSLSKAIKERARGLAGEERGPAQEEDTGTGETDPSTQAISDLNEAIRLNPEDAEAWEFRGFAYLCVGNAAEEGIRDCTEALRINPECANTLTIRAELFTHMENYQEAIDDLTRAIELDPANLNYLWQRKETHLKMGNTREARVDEAARKRIFDEKIWNEGSPYLF